MNPEKVADFHHWSEQRLALTFDDVRLRTQSNPNEPLPEIISVESRFSRNVELKIPFVSAAMDTVTTADMAITLAKLGGLGVIHAGLNPEDQKREVRRVKHSLSGLIERPITLQQDRTLQSVLKECDSHHWEFRTFPVVDSTNRFVGIITQNDFDFGRQTDTVGQVMTPSSDVFTAKETTDVQQAHDLMIKNKKKTIPLISEEGEVAGLYVFSDVRRIIRGDAAAYNVDSKGRLRVAAAVSTDQEGIDRVRLMEKYLDVAVIDSADGDSFYAFKTLDALKEEFPSLDVVVGNISEGNSAELLAHHGADGIKVGQGPGSICTTRVETGIGMPQVTAVYEAVRALEKAGLDVPVCADGGIRNHGDLSIAIAAGAHSVMMGSMLAGTTEAPGRIITKENGARVKLYRGMGSPSAMRDSAASRKRYGETGQGEPLAEGVESEVPYKGSVADIVTMGVKALRKSMRYVKAADIESHRMNTRMRRITSSGLRESHPHDVKVVTE